MKIKLSDYIAEYVLEHGIKDVFTVVGGGAMHLNDSLGHKAGLHSTYHHHEQAASIAAESYYRVNNEMALLCVTSGPGAINALNGVAGAYMDSIPMIVLSGQTKSTLTVQSSALPLRTLGNQEFDIIPCVKTMTKYSVMITDAREIKKHLDIAFKMAISGRPGPCWLDIPLDIQGTFIETDDLKGAENNELPEENSNGFSLNDDQKASLVSVEDYDFDSLIGKITSAKRPVIYGGNAIRISGGYELFRKLIDKLNIPVVTGWNSIDLLPTEHPLYCGRGGIMGDRAGNFAVQNSDLLISFGSRLSIYQVGYNIDTWARAAHIIAVDIDPAELVKPTIKANERILGDIVTFMSLLNDRLEEGYGNALHANSEWNKQCESWKNTYKVAKPAHFEQDAANVYAFIDTLSRMIPEGMNTVVANGSASVVGSQTYYIKENQRFIMNCALSSMGYELPAAIGACIADNRKPLVCIAGDGSIQMNIQELQTIITNKLPIKIFVINNEGYHQIRLTQSNIFKEHTRVGLGPESGDLSFPDMEKLAYAYGYKYLSCNKNSEISDFAEKALKEEGPVIAEIFVDTKQVYEPKSATKRLEDGSLYSPPLEDLAPFLSPEELKKNMYI